MKIKQLLTKSLLVAVMLCAGAGNMWGQASYNHSYTVGATVAAGGDYFLYNIGAGQFLTNGLWYGTHAAVDNSGRVLTLTASDNGYTIYTNYVSLNNRTDSKAGYLNSDGYVDTNDQVVWSFESVNLNGYSNVYTIKNSNGSYLIYNSTNNSVNVGESTSDNKSYWLLIPKSTRETAGDYSHYLINTQMNACWEWKTWSGSTDNTWDILAIGPTDTHPENVVGDKYHVIYDIYQDVTENVPNGKYKLYAQTSFTDGTSDAAPVLYANDDTQPVAIWNATDDGDAGMVNASIAYSAGKYTNNVSTVVTNNKLRVGVKMTVATQWVTFDNFVLEYLGTTLTNDAVAFTNGAEMTADTWYYYDIPSSTFYKVVAGSDLSAISYTRDGTQLTASATAGSNFTNPQSLTAGRVYIKSSSAQTLTFTEDPVAAAIADCKAWETSSEFATYIDGGSYASAEEVYAAHTAWQVANGTASKAILNNTVTSADHFWGTLKEGANYDGAPDTKYLSNDAEYNVHQKVYGIPAGVYEVSAWTYASAAVYQKLYISKVVGNDWTDLAQPETNASGWKKLSATITLTEDANIAFGFYAGAIDGGTTGFDNWTLTKINSVTATITPTGYATFSSPYALDFSNQIDNLDGAYYASAVESGKVTMTKLNQTVPAETGLFLKGTANATVTIPVVASGTDINGTNFLKPNTSESTVAASTENAYHYVFAYTTSDGSNPGFFNLASPVTLGAGKAYLETKEDIKPAQSQGAKVSILFFDDNLTGIQSIDASSNVNANADKMYNLGGQLVGEDYKGIVIVNGKKVIK